MRIQARAANPAARQPVRWAWSRNRIARLHLPSQFGSGRAEHIGLDHIKDARSRQELIENVHLCVARGRRDRVAGEMHIRVQDLHVIRPMNLARGIAE